MCIYRGQGTFAQCPLRKRSLRNGHFAKYTLRSWTLRGRTLRGGKLRPTNTLLMDTSRADTSRTKNVKIFLETHNCFFDQNLGLFDQNFLTVQNMSFLTKIFEYSKISNHSQNFKKFTKIQKF